LTRRSKKKSSSAAANGTPSATTSNTASSNTNSTTLASNNADADDEELALTGTSVPYDPAVDSFAQQQKPTAVTGTASNAFSTASSASSSSSSSSALPKGRAINKAIGFTEEPSSKSMEGGQAASHSRPPTPSVVRSEADLIGTAVVDGEDEEDADLLPSPPPPPSLQTVPILQMQALQLHNKSAVQYKHDQQLLPNHPSKDSIPTKVTATTTSSAGALRTCFSPPPPAIVAASASTTSRQLPHYPPALTLPKPTPLWATPATSGAGSSSNSSSLANAGARQQRPSSVSTDLYSVASTISVTTVGSNCPAVVSSMPIMRTFGAAAGAKRQNSFGS
uniref:Uncharacterized protein n=1 Tax=Anopheles atroparvus TaxID=41427 RepID=A0A182J8H6_ANOAO